MPEWGSVQLVSCKLAPLIGDVSWLAGWWVGLENIASSCLTSKLGLLHPPCPNFYSSCVNQAHNCGQNNEQTSGNSDLVIDDKR